MQMIIAVEKGLDTVADALKASGHTVIDLENARSFDAAVYMTYGIAQIPTPSMQINPGGILLVSAHGRTPDEICAIISQKAYRKLFEIW